MAARASGGEYLAKCENHDRVYFDTEAIRLTVNWRIPKSIFFDLPLANQRLLLLAVHRFKITLLFFLAGTMAAFSGEPIGQFDDQADIGSPKLSGSATYDSASQDYTLSGAGTNMWFSSDQFHFTWKKMKGDFILRTRTEFIGKG